MTKDITLWEVQSLQSETFVLSMLYNFFKAYSFRDYTKCLGKVKIYWKEWSGIDYFQNFYHIFPSGSALNLQKAFIVVFSSSNKTSYPLDSSKQVRYLFSFGIHNAIVTIFL